MNENKQIKTMLKEYQENKALIKELEALNASIQCDIIKEMNGSGSISEGGYTATYSTYKPTFLDSTRLKAENPKAYEYYSTVKEVPRFTVKGV